MKKSILFVGAEVMPFAATGGLGDVLGSLPAAIKAKCGDADVSGYFETTFMPYEKSRLNGDDAKAKDTARSVLVYVFTNNIIPIFNK